MRRNVNRNGFNDRKNVSATAPSSFLTTSDFQDDGIVDLSELKGTSFFRLLKILSFDYGINTTGTLFVSIYMRHFRQSTQ